MIFIHQKRNKNSSTFYVSADRNKIFPHYVDKNNLNGFEDNERKKRQQKERFNNFKQKFRNQRLYKAQSFQFDENNNFLEKISQRNIN